jgi:drug/metabolite transporter (DMT)-like permease
VAPVSVHWRIGFVCALLTAAVWGTLPIALKLLLGPMAPATVVWYRFAFAAVFITIVQRLRGPLQLPEKSRRRLPLLAIVVIGFSANNLSFMLGLEYISPTSAQVMIQLAPLLVVAAGVFLFHESFGGLQYIGAPMLAGGILLFFHDRLGKLFSGASSSGIGLLLIALAAFTWAAFTIAQKKLLPVYGSFRLMWLIYGVGVLLVTPLASPAEALQLDGWGALILLYGCASTVIGYGLFSEALKTWEASRVGAVVAVTPLFTWGLTHAGERWFPESIFADPIDGWSIVGACSVAVGSALAALGRGPTASAPTPVQAPPPEADPEPAGQSRYPTRS